MASTDIFVAIKEEGKVEKVTLEAGEGMHERTLRSCSDQLSVNWQPLKGMHEGSESHFNLHRAGDK